MKNAAIDAICTVTRRLRPGEPSDRETKLARAETNRGDHRRRAHFPIVVGERRAEREKDAGVTNQAAHDLPPHVPVADEREDWGAIGVGFLERSQMSDAFDKRVARQLRERS